MSNERFLLCKEVVNGIRSCFTHEQLQVLEYTQGTRVITVEKQFMFFYKDYETAYKDKEEFYDAFCFIIGEQEHIIKRLQLFYSRLETLLTPDSYRDDTYTLGSVITEGDTTENNTEETTYKNERLYTSNTESIDINKNTTVTKAGDTQTSKLYDVEREWIAQEIETPQVKQIIKKVITMEEDETVINEEVGVTKEPLINTGEKTPISYNAINFNKSSIGESLYSFLQTQSGTKDRSNSNKLGTKGTTNNSEIKTDQHVYTYNRAKIIYDSLTEEMPQLRFQFWTGFASLFNIV